jgi:hypothetical protein
MESGSNPLLSTARAEYSCPLSRNTTHRSRNRVRRCFSLLVLADLRLDEPLEASHVHRLTRRERSRPGPCCQMRNDISSGMRLSSDSSARIARSAIAVAASSRGSKGGRPAARSREPVLGAVPARRRIKTRGPVAHRDRPGSNALRRSTEWLFPSGSTTKESGTAKSSLPYPPLWAAKKTWRFAEARRRRRPPQRAPGSIDCAAVNSSPRRTSVELRILDRRRRPGTPTRWIRSPRQGAHRMSSLSFGPQTGVIVTGGASGIGRATLFALTRSTDRRGTAG